MADKTSTSFAAANAQALVVVATIVAIAANLDKIIAVVGG